MRFEVLVLGSNSALAAHGRLPTSQVVYHMSSIFLVDCGEGTQFQLSNCHVRWSHIEHIFISHLHGDHVFGLPGLITSFATHRRKTPLHVYGPKGIRDMVQTLLHYSGSHLTFPLKWVEIDRSERILLYKSKTLKVYSFPVRHRIPTYGFLFQERPGERNIDPAAIDKYHLDYRQIKAAKKGEDVILENGRIIANTALTLPAKPLRTYAYCADTVYDEQIVPYVRDADLLYHEATFLHALLDKARATMHSTALQAGMLARKAHARQLLIGHYSSRYKDLQPLKAEAEKNFSPVLLGVEGGIYPVSAKIPEKDQQ